jgi:hypothetical protein
MYCTRTLGLVDRLEGHRPMHTTLNPRRGAQLSRTLHVSTGPSRTTAFCHHRCGRCGSLACLSPGAGRRLAARMLRCALRHDTWYASLVCLPCLVIWSFQVFLFAFCTMPFVDASSRATGPSRHSAPHRAIPWWLRIVNSHPFLVCIHSTISCS